MTKVSYDTPAVCTESPGNNTQLHFPVSRIPGELLWGSQDSDSLGYVNQYGHSRKHIFDSVQQSLKRLQLDCIDVLQCSLPFSSSLACMVASGNRRSLASLTSHFFFPPQAIVLIIIPLSRKWCVLGGTANNCGSIALIAHNIPPLWQMQALHDVVQKGWVRYIGMSSCWAYQCKHPSLRPAHRSALIRLLSRKPVHQMQSEYYLIIYHGLEGDLRAHSSSLNRLRDS
jgi:aryl-alcohol dehydrogenase-like predicted oxidoreductase